MIPFGWSGCGQDKVMLLGVRLTWCIIGTAEGTAVKRRKHWKLLLLLGVLWRIPVCQSYSHPACLQHNCYMLGSVAFLRFGSWPEDFSGTQDCIWPAKGESWLCLLLYCGKWQGRQGSKEHNYLAKHKYPYPLGFKVLLQRICSFCLRLKVGSPTSKLHNI